MNANGHTAPHSRRAISCHHIDRTILITKWVYGGRYSLGKYACLISGENFKRRTSTHIWRTASYADVNQEGWWFFQSMSNFTGIFWNSWTSLLLLGKLQKLKVSTWEVRFDESRSYITGYAGQQAHKVRARLSHSHWLGHTWVRQQIKTETASPGVSGSFPFPFPKGFFFFFF